MFALPVEFYFLGAIAVFASFEYSYFKKVTGRVYPKKLALLSGVLVVLHVLANAILAFIPIAIFGFVWSHRLFTIPVNTLPTYLGLFIAAEFAYYCQHRMFHEIRLFWCAHSVHHMPNQLTSMVSGWRSLVEGSLIAWPAFLPVFFLGFEPHAILRVNTCILLANFFYHNEICPKLGPLEWLIQTPSRHRVHHSANSEYLNRNYGGITTIFDYLFFTSKAEHEDIKCQIGLTDGFYSESFAEINLHEFRKLWRDVCGTNNWPERLGYVFLAPGWVPKRMRLQSNPDEKHSAA